MKEKLKQQIAELEPKEQAMYAEYNRLVDLKDIAGREWLNVRDPLEALRRKLALIEEMEKEKEVLASLPARD